MENEFLHDPAMIHDFLVESEELLQGMDQDMVSLESFPKDSDLLNRIFRALHTIKGTAGFLAFEPLVRLSHHAEDVLNDLRRNEIHLSQRVMDSLLAARDQLGVMLRDIRLGGLRSYEIEGLLAELKAVQMRETAPSVSNSPGIQAQKTDNLAPDRTRTQNAPTGSADPMGDLSQTMRVNVSKLDELINLVGELVLERNRLVRIAGDLHHGRLGGEDLNTALAESTGRLSFITEELQTSGLKTRMVPIDTVFRKFPRLVRDTAHALGKEVELQVHGQETEVDKTVVELIGDPLVHLVRNSLDHGLEMPAVREATGKKRQGVIRLDARQEGDQIVVSVADDGAGIEPKRVVHKAIERELVTADRARLLTKKEILDFIFLPGFSTVEKVNDLSGRGVGMDVVRSNLKRMNGTIELESTPGAGTTVVLHLPLTLAILPVLLVRVAEETYGLPLRSVVETSQIQLGEVHRVEGREVLHQRGKTLPLLRLGTMFSNQGVGAGPANGKVVILSVGEKRLALAVDDLIGQESTVIKPLGTYLHNCPGIAGATIGGDGRVRLVLDPAGLLASVGASSPRVVVQ